MSIAAQLPLVTDEPIGERIGGYLFWGVLILLIGVIVWALRRRRRGPRPSGAAGKVTWTRTEDYAEHHRVAWQADPGSFVTRPEHWPLAVTAVFGICGGEPWDRLALHNLDVARDGLEEAWGIRSRAQLLSRLHWLLREGHRVGFADEVADGEELDDAEARRVVAGAAGTASSEVREHAWRLKQVRADARGIRSVVFVAWDLVRAAMLTRAGFSLGWLSEQEADDTLRLISAELQRSYDGWEEMGDHFLRARWFWGGNTSQTSRQNDAHDASRQAALLAPPRRPWSHVPWIMPIPDSRVLLVDAMLREGLIEQVPVHSPTRLAEVLDGVTSERLAAQG
ncbi:DUF1266 domain-containing protein [Microbacterium sp. Mu-80]|uniref:DUF1266 domain-containing protein n=1 Tax=Microbacterium bandirmense TaxID=3122050 RepID=A0ABU8L8Z8_9MICO